MLTFVNTAGRSLTRCLICISLSIRTLGPDHGLAWFLFTGFFIGVPPRKKHSVILGLFRPGRVRVPRGAGNHGMHRGSFRE